MEEDLKVRDKVRYLVSFQTSSTIFSNNLWNADGPSQGTWQSKLSCSLSDVMPKICQPMNKHIWNRNFRFMAEGLRSSRFEDSLVRAARTRTLAATNYNADASIGRTLVSSCSLCNEVQSPRPSAILTTDRPRPGRWNPRSRRRFKYTVSSNACRPKGMGHNLGIP